MILCCAEGLPNKVVAEMGIHEHTVGAISIMGISSYRSAG